MKVFWTDRAEFEFKQTLAYWTIHNMSATYSNKILQETKILEKSLIESPYFLATYIEKIEAYRRVFLKESFRCFMKLMKQRKLFVFYVLEVLRKNHCIECSKIL